MANFEDIINSKRYKIITGNISVGRGVRGEKGEKGDMPDITPFKNDYESLKKIIIDENASANLQDQINNITLLAGTFGIKADGTDQTTSINNLISYINSRLDVGKIIFPKGTLLINKTIHINNPLQRKIEIIGNNTEIKLANQSNCFHNHQPMFLVGKNVTIKGFKFNGNYDENYYEVDGTKHYMYQDNDNNIRKGSIAVLLSGADNSKVLNCEFIDISWSSCDLGSGNNVEIAYNTFYNGGQDYTPLHNCNNVWVHNNVYYRPNNHCAHAYSNCSNATIERNTVYVNNDYYKRYKNSGKMAIYIDHNAYPLSEVKNIRVLNNNIYVSEDFTEEEFYGIGWTGYAKNVIIEGNIIETNSHSVFAHSPILGRLLLENNILYSREGYGIYYRILEEHGSIGYSVADRTGKIFINNNTIKTNSVACIGFHMLDDTVVDVDKQIIEISNNKYENNGTTKYIEVTSIEAKHEVHINEDISANLIQDYKCGFPYVRGKLYLGNSYKENKWFNSDFVVTGFNSSGNPIPALINNRSNGTISTYVGSVDANNVPILTINTNGTPTSHSAIYYEIGDKNFLSGKYIHLHFKINLKESHSVTIQIIRDGEQSVFLGSAMLNVGDTVIDRSVYIPPVKAINRGKFMLQIIFDLGASSYTEIVNAIISDVKLVEGMCINSTDVVVNNNAINTINNYIVKPLILYSQKAPTTGNYLRGDRVINTNPTVGNPKSWVCTESGSPGTWVSEGNL